MKRPLLEASSLLNECYSPYLCVNIAHAVTRDVVLRATPRQKRALVLHFDLEDSSRYVRSTLPAGAAPLPPPAPSGAVSHPHLQMASIVREDADVVAVLPREVNAADETLWQQQEEEEQ